MILKTKHPSSTSGTKSSLRGTTQIRLNKQTLFVAVTGFPGADYFIHQRSRSCEQSGEFGLMCSRGHWCWASTSLSQLADGITYYSCFNFSFGRDDPAPTNFMVDPEGFEPSTFSMPLRRAPNCAMGPDKSYSERSGPEGIRTPDLLSAIEARSQLRYRPVVQKATAILPEGGGNVNEGLRCR